MLDEKIPSHSEVVMEEISQWKEGCITSLDLPEANMREMRTLRTKKKTNVGFLHGFYWKPRVANLNRDTYYVLRRLSPIFPFVPSLL